MQRILLAEANARLQEKAAPAAPAFQISTRFAQDLHQSNRSASEGTLEMGTSRYLSNDSKSAAILAPTFTAATGELDLGENNVDYGPRTTQQNVGKGKGRNSEDMFTKIPVQPAAGPSSVAATTPSSLARSKSQLTLLLEKDRARGGEHKPKEDKRKGRKG
jgi:hypothetical protein